MVKIIIDAGHGGEDVGAVGLYDDNEARINIVTAKFLVDRLRSRGTFEVLMTRTGTEEVSLGKRLQSVKEDKPDLFVSLHCNAFHDPGAHGFEVLYADKYDVKLGQDILDAMQVRFKNMKNRGLKQDKEWLGHRLAVLKDVETPCVLVEMGFITNPFDYMILMLPDAMAEAIELGILRYCSDEIYHDATGHPI